jgi:hypothetical protein
MLDAFETQTSVGAGHDYGFAGEVQVRDRKSAESLPYQHLDYFAYGGHDIGRLDEQRRRVREEGEYQLN